MLSCTLMVHNWTLDPCVFFLSPLRVRSGRLGCRPHKIGVSTIEALHGRPSPFLLILRIYETLYLNALRSVSSVVTPILCGKAA